MVQVGGGGLKVLRMSYEVSSAFANGISCCQFPLFIVVLTSTVYCSSSHLSLILKVTGGIAVVSLCCSAVQTLPVSQHQTRSTSIIHSKKNLQKQIEVARRQEIAWKNAHQHQVETALCLFLRLKELFRIRSRDSCWVLYCRSPFEQ